MIKITIQESKIFSVSRRDILGERMREWVNRAHSRFETTAQQLSVKLTCDGSV